MTRETFLKAKRAAGMTQGAGKRTLDAIQNGTFWTAFRESVYASFYAFLPETDIDAVPAV